MTHLGKCLTDKQLAEARVSQKTGAQKLRSSQLSKIAKTNSKPTHLNMAAIAVGINRNKVIENKYWHLKLKE